MAFLANHICKRCGVGFESYKELKAHFTKTHGLTTKEYGEAGYF